MPETLLPYYGDYTVRSLVEFCRERLGVTQDKLAEVAGSSKRTVSRWQGGAATPADFHLVAMARAVYALDRPLADALCAEAGTDLLRAGIEAPPPPPPPPPQPPAAPVRPQASIDHLVDSVLCAAATAAVTTPQAIRPAVAAAFERAVAVGLSPDEIRAVLAPSPTSKRTKAGAS